MVLENGSLLEGVEVLVVKFSSNKTKKGQDFFSLQVRDKTSEVDCKIWNANSDLKPILKTGNVVRIWATVGEYGGKPQLTINRVEPSDSDPATFAKGTRFDVEALWTSVSNVIESFEEPLTKGIAENLILSEGVITSLFKKAPAATNVHNNWVGGLLEHVWSMCQLAEPMIAHYKKRYRAKLSRDKILFGVIVHDLCKIVEYDCDNPAFPLTPTGLLTNHIVIGPAWIYHASKKIKDMYEDTPKFANVNWNEETSHLMHLAASHHGQIEWGSPVKPATLEAVLLHFLDNMDSKFMHALDLIENGEGPITGFSGKSYYEGVHYKL